MVQFFYSLCTFIRWTGCTLTMALS